MRMLMALVFGCAMMIGVHQAASQAASASALRATPPSAEPASSITDDTGDDATHYICEFSPLCQRAAQCTEYCAGGIPVCFQGCCACAS